MIDKDQYFALKNASQQFLTDPAFSHVQVEDVMMAIVMGAYILPYFSVFYTDLFGEGLVFKSLLLVMIRWSVTCCHHMHS